MPSLKVGADDQTQSSTSSSIRLPVLSDQVAWERMPQLEQEVADRRLPIWAKVLAGPLPRTAAAMLELDNAYRTSEDYDPKLRGKMRWIAAQANRCSYSQAYAEADLNRLGVPSSELEQLKSNRDGKSEQEKAAFEFAHKLTVAANTVTDDEVSQLISAFGERQVVAMVLQMAYANFQDRLLLTLGAEVEETGPLPPQEIYFIPPEPRESIVAQRPTLTNEKRPDAPNIELGREWKSIPFEQLLLGMERQQDRPGRVSVPTWDEVFLRLPAGMYPADRPIRIKWSLVVLGHQPRLGSTWMQTMRTFGREANQSRVFEETLFWVITRTIDCFY